MSHAIEFPSPHGESTFQIEISRLYGIRRKEVSVPSRGIYIPNNSQRLAKKQSGGVSVPSRGIYIPNHYLQCTTPYLIWFPSPHGESTFQMVINHST